MAIVKHIKSRNANYSAAINYLLFEHDEKTGKKIVDESRNIHTHIVINSVRKTAVEHKDITDDGQTVTIKEVPEVPDTPKDTDTPDTPSTVTKTSDSPKTGDNTNIYAYLAMLGLSCVGLGGMLYFKRRKKKS